MSLVIMIHLTCPQLWKYLTGKSLLIIPMSFSLKIKYVRFLLKVVLI